MAYYHIKIELSEKDKNGNNETKYQVDIQSEEDVLVKFLIPFQKLKTFRVNGYFIKPTSVNRLVVTTSTQSADDIVNILDKKFEEINNDSSLIFLSLGHSHEQAIENNEYVIEVTDELLEKANVMIKSAVTNSQITKNYESTNQSSNKVFIVHGRDNTAKIEVARFIEKLGLQAIILHEQSDNGLTIIEKIEQYSIVSYGIVLYTDCDEGRLKGSQDLQARARQNVIFEHGFLISKLGRNRITALVKGKIEIPNDLSGVVYTTMDDYDGWKLKLMKELANVGFDIDFSKA